MLSIQHVLSAVAAGFLLFAAGAAPAQAKNSHIYYAFPGGKRGSQPSQIVRDALGNLFGTTAQGGGACNCGTIFKITPDGKESILHSFRGGKDGGDPLGGLILDDQGNLYGTTFASSGNHGTVFQLSADGRLKTLHTFTDSSDGAYPTAAPILDKAGNLYGTTAGGGAYNEGTVYKLSSDGTLSLLYTFTEGTDGGGPLGSLIMDHAGALYGTTEYGGYGGDGFCGSGGCGTVFKVTQSGKETVLYTFLGSADGVFPLGSLVRDKEGNLYGTTPEGGAEGGGTIFKVTPIGTKTDLYDFVLQDGGGDPQAGLVSDRNGNLYGAAQGGYYGGGVVFELATDGKYSVLHDFMGDGDGRAPSGNLTIDRAGNLYGATTRGGDLNCDAGYGCGTVFRIKN
jgi:uncharacterized repeat protein (TIGR03803 family)